jgi:predicted AlkP superfamily phosphohydrolase/phosphomutase
VHTLLLGFDAFDPKLFENLAGRGRLPNLASYADRGGYARFGVVNPPQSEVSWTSIATGLDPGGHGIFDFVHRDPKSYTPYVSLLPTRRGLGGIQFTPPTTARTIFEQATQKGYQATSLWWPATFPARPGLPVNTFPGLGTPDILGKLGVGTFFTSDPEYKHEKMKTAVEILEAAGKDRFSASLKGPARQKQGDLETASLPVEIDILEKHLARIRIGAQSVEVPVGKWSPIIELTFKIGLLVKITAITRLILTRVEPDVNLYMLPLQIHPLHSPWPYATPPGFTKRVWGAHGPFLTIGWPQDTTGLEDGCITDDQFLDLCDSIFEKREQILLFLLKDFREGLLASVFDTLDRIQHMFWRDRLDIVEGWYLKLDGLIGRVESALKENGRARPRILVVSDHGFTDFHTKIHLNRWLIDRGHMVPREPLEKGKLADVDWSRSKAYALGLNSLYLNLEGREGKGFVRADEAEKLVDELRTELAAWRSSAGMPVISHLATRSEAFAGSLAEYGPDLMVGYAPGFRASPQTGLGEWEAAAMEPNRDHWSADHCIDPEAVPGVLFSDDGLAGLPSPTFRDVPQQAIGESIGAGNPPPPPAIGGEDQEMLEERLKSLGYL